MIGSRTLANDSGLVYDGDRMPEKLPKATRAHGEAVEQAMRATPAGVAHFSGLTLVDGRLELRTDGLTCRHCEFFFDVKRSRWNSLQDGRCSEAQRMLKKIMPRFPHTTSACRYFVARDGGPVPNIASV